VVNTPDDKHDGKLEQQTRTVFERQVASLDAHTLSRLNQARQAALDAARKNKAIAMPRWLMPASSVAALALTAVIALHYSRQLSSGDVVTQSSPALEDVEIVAAADDIDLLQDVDFYDSLDSVDAGDSEPS